MDYETFWNRYISIFLPLGGDIAFLIQLTNLANEKEVLLPSTNPPTEFDLSSIQQAEKISPILNYISEFAVKSKMDDFPVRGDLGNYYGDATALYKECIEILKSDKASFSPEVRKLIRDSLNKLRDSILSVKNELLADFQDATGIDPSQWERVSSLSYRQLPNSTQPDTVPKEIDGNDKLIYDAIILFRHFDGFRNHEYKPFWDSYISIFLEVGDDITFLLKLNSLCSREKLNFSHASPNSPFPVDIDKINASKIQTFNYAKVFGERRTIEEYPVKGDLQNYFAHTLSLYYDAVELRFNPIVKMDFRAAAAVEKSIEALSRAIKKVRPLLQSIEVEREIRLDEWVRMPEVTDIARHQYDSCEIHPDSTKHKLETSHHSSDPLLNDAAKINNWYRQFDRLERDRTCPQI